MPTSIAERLNAARGYYFVGRAQELELFQFLTRAKALLFNLNFFTPVKSTIVSANLRMR